MPELTCARCGRTMPRMEQPPMAGPWGVRIQDGVCLDCWKAWQEEQTIVINHYGLKPHLAADRERLYQHMAEFLRLDEPQVTP